MIKTSNDPKGAKDARRYQAYRTDAYRREHLRFWPVAVERYALPYLYLMSTAGDKNAGTWIELRYSFLKVKIVGRNLQPLAEAIATKICEFLQEYDPERFSPPAKDAPVITGIETVMGGEYELLMPPEN